MLTFVAGPPRSGTTLLQSILCHSLGARFLAECAPVLSVLNHRLAYLHIGGDRHPEFFDCDDAMLDTGAKRYLQAVLAHVLDADSVVLKSPELCHYLLCLPRFFEGPMQTVCIVRDPRDAIASLMRVRVRQGKERNLVDAADFLGQFYDEIARALDCPPANNPVYLVRYEGLVGRDRAGLQALACSLKMPVNVSGHAGIDADALDPANAWHSDLYAKPITPERIGSYKDYLTPDEIGAIDESYARFYERFGYARHEDTPGVKQAA